MRDALLLAVILISLIAALRFPFVGLLVWAWFSLMTPHQLAFGTFGIPLNMLIAAVTVGALAVNGAFVRMRFDLTILLLVLFAFWLCLSQLYSLNPENSFEYFDRFLKTLVFVLLCTQVANTRLRVNALIWVLVLSLGFYAMKGALFTLATFGEFRVQGLPNTILEDNNHMGIALAATLPMILYLRAQSARGEVRTALAVLFGLTVFSIIGTQSRGAFLSLVAFGGILSLRSKNKVAILAAAAFLAIPAIIFMPSKWTERMSTITEATQDASFMGRVDAWVINTKFALENPMTGAGLRNPYDRDLAMEVDPERAPRAKAAHSIYFEILGGAGFVGLGIYLALLGAAFLNTRRLSRMKPDAFTPEWIPVFGHYAQISLIVFCIGGASTSMEMWDGYLLVLALAASVNWIAKEATRDATLPRATASRWRMRARGHTPAE